jgi:predicted ATPase/DNA-binding XRE family transcriptional regulator
MLLRRYRLAAGLSQEALAERARMSKNGIGALERGYRRTPRRETLGFLAVALALDAEQRRTFEATAARSGALRRHGGASVTVGPWPHARTSNLPLALTNFVGRSSELGEISALVRAHRLVTVTGAGGVGKTQTALQVGRSFSDEAGVTVAFAGLAPIGAGSLVVAVIAAAVAVQEVPNRPLRETLVAYLKNRALLLILDNCEHVVGEAANVVEALFIGCPRVRILATSREPLRAAGEHIYRLPSLSATDAMALFTDRARAVDLRLALTDETAPIVADICRRLDRIPLAIELAAARVNLLSLKALAEKLDDRFPILTHGERTALPRQQTMRATIDWSYELLSAPEQRFFERLSIFAGGCTFTTAATVCGDGDTPQADLLELLSSLVDKSLVIADLDGSEPRYRLLDSFRQYAREKLASHGEQEIVARRHALACLELARRLDRAYDSEPDEVWLELSHEELDNWRTALKWALTDRGDVVLGQALVGELRFLWQYFAPVQGKRWLVPARDLIDDSTPVSVLAKLDCAEADIAWQLRDYHLQLSSSKSAIERHQAVGDVLGVSRAQSLAAYALLSLGRFVDAQSLLQEALITARRLKNRRLVAYLLRGLGYAKALDGDVVAARALVAEALENYEAIGATRSAAMPLMHDLAWFEFHAGNPGLALQHETEALQQGRKLNSVRMVIYALSAISGFLLALDRYDEADERAREALFLARDQHLEVLVAEALQHLAASAALRVRASVDALTWARARAARILGFVDARLAAMGSTRIITLQPEYDRVMAALRDAVGPDELVRIMAAGAAMSEEQVFREVT